MSPPLLQVEGLRKTFSAGGYIVRAVDSISITVARGESLGIVGESGCGKSTLARCILRLIEPTAGEVHFDGIDILALDPAAMRQMRRRMQIVFQDGSGALDPRMSARSLVEEPLAIHGLGRSARRQAAEQMLALVGIPMQAADDVPARFSGGQRQRIGIARALVLKPDLLVLDEPVSAVDMSVQAQILNLLRDMQDRLHLTYLLIVHNLTVAEFFCDRVAVIYLGRIVEIATSVALARQALHPYTVSLFSGLRREGQERIVLRGEVSSLGGTPARGCPFQPRCPIGRHRELCSALAPPLAVVGSDHQVACHFPGALTA